MKTDLVALLLVVVLVVSSSDVTPTRDEPNYFQDTCAATISKGPGCDSGKCAADCQSRFRGGVGACQTAGCQCVYTCPSSPPAGGEKR
ncbi:hypothetical protein EJB05_20284 [Eragrostis curvula]|uniref:Knottin scorpion toxin-like domain-containing protein n=1 Tax=Eragrostis curvula TaxID=38414 RepID=A0A5J9UXX1_9POAL|nr:hypothetical protein EJB05_56860 [Eragrostis curvula]TVU28752.1 hypothetical protein EJB05_20284 [Eragrostis curvula]